jgi:Transposase.
MAYEVKFKERVLEYLSEGHTQRETAAIFKVSRDALQKWKRQVAQTGNLEPKKLERPAKKLPREELRAYVSANPDAYLSEIAEHFGCTGTAVSKALKVLNITRKKRQ